MVNVNSTREQTKQYYAQALKQNKFPSTFQIPIFMAILIKEASFCSKQRLLQNCPNGENAKKPDSMLLFPN